MDIYASAALTGLGYSLSKQRDNLKNSEKIESMGPSENPSNRNMYSSSILANTTADELTRGTNTWNKSQNPLETGIVPRPAYADQFARPNFSDADANDVSSFQSLTGDVMKSSDLKHNNMQPFIGMKEVEQFSDGFDNGAQRLQQFTGRGVEIQRKTEQPCMFEPTSGFGYVCGMPSVTDFFQERTQPGKNRNNDFPIEQVRVGRGLGQGFTSDPSGGYQQSDTLDYVKPKNVDELRVATKPRMTYELPPQGPAGSQINQSADQTQIGEFSKNRPDKFFEQTEDMLLHTTGAYLKDSLRPIQEVKPTARVDTHITYEGNAHNKTSHPGTGEHDTYGKETIMTFNNNRQITSERTVLNNLRSTVKAIISPLLDLFRHTTKEYLIDAPRQNGVLQAQIPSKPTTYDPVTHMMRTTTKEQLIDAPRQNGILQAQIPSKATTYDPVNHMMRTTIKETTVQDSAITNLKGNTKPTTPNDDNARTTVRETTANEDTTRNISSHSYNVTVYNTDSIALTTIRETTAESSSALGFMGGNVTKATGAYNITDIELKNNVKQYSTVAYDGIAGSKSDFRHKSDEAEQNSRIDPTRDILNQAAGHTPNGSGEYASLEPDNFNQEAKRLIRDDFAPREVPNKTVVWQATAQEIPECAVTHQYDYLNANKNRLDESVLSALATNPYNLAINPIRKVPAIAEVC